MLATLLSRSVYALNAPDGKAVQIAPGSAVAPVSLPSGLIQMQANDGSFMLSVPVGWIKTTLAPAYGANVQLSAMNVGKDLSLTVSTNNAVDIQDVATWSKALQTRLAATLTQSTSTPFEDIKVNGFDGVRAEVYGIQNGARLHYLLTMVKTDKYFIYFMSASFESRFAANRSDLEQIPNSLRF